MIHQFALRVAYDPECNSFDVDVIDCKQQIKVIGYTEDPLKLSALINEGSRDLFDKLIKLQTLFDSMEDSTE